MASRCISSKIPAMVLRSNASKADLFEQKSFDLVRVSMRAWPGIFLDQRSKKSWHKQQRLAAVRCGSVGCGLIIGIRHDRMSVEERRKQRKLKGSDRPVTSCDKLSLCVSLGFSDLQ